MEEKTTTELYPLKPGDIVLSGETDVPSVILITDTLANRPEEQHIAVRFDYKFDLKHDTADVFFCTFEIMERYDRDVVFSDLDDMEYIPDGAEYVLNDWGDYEQIDEDTFLIKYSRQE